MLAALGVQGEQLGGVVERGDLGGGAGLVPGGSADLAEFRV